MSKNAEDLMDKCRETARVVRRLNESTPSQSPKSASERYMEIGDTFLSLAMKYYELAQVGARR